MDKLTDQFPTAEEAQKETDVFASQPEAKDEQVEKEDPQENEDEPKNRRYRRLESRFQAEREANIALNARLQAISETQKFREETGAEDIDQNLARIYGTNTPEAKEATQLLQQALKKSTDKAVERALERFQEERAKENTEVAREESTLDSFMETIEDEFNVDLTSNTAEAKRARDTFLDTLERLSPKRDGEIVEYADPIATWEYAQSKLNRPSNRAKELSSRGMTRGGTSAKVDDSKAHEKYLREQGLI